MSGIGAVKGRREGLQADLRLFSNIFGPTLMFALVLVFVAGCGKMPVKETDRDISSIYSGHWIGIIDGTEEVQRSSSYTYYCNKFTGRAELEISGGIVKGRLKGRKGATFETYIDRSGYFQGRIPTNISMRGSHININPPTVTLVIEGELSKEDVNGTFTYAISKDGLNGCRTDIYFLRTH